MTRKPVPDPRTVARNIPGVFDSIFPQLTPSVIAHFNQTAESSNCNPVPLEMVQESKLQKAMLFELGFAVGETLLATSSDIDWSDCVQVSVARQRRYFDAEIPNEITELDRRIAEMVGNNIASMILELALERGHSITAAPLIPGFQWIASGQGDFAAGPTLIEVKCSNKNFSASDYRQIVMYWLLSFSASVEVERNRPEWSEGILLNPRSGKYVALRFDDFLHVISAGRTKVEILQLFSSMVGTRDLK
ncbi:hypothetical protein [Quatrionicoccus australiensis]|uniref:hypothetical protein n=1 Tax=Quatrionicoccus australiensis TaxID=138118 RepID=UPI001CF9F7F1|nr:hypothetical protein [Quatrionicoccus australiensis]MCB4361418.1 hypothetical protein [Quatrionicoccus australiensis]